MSAYLCDACHLTALAIYARRECLFRSGSYRDLAETERAAFDLLARANWTSVRHRYPDHADPGVVQGLCPHGQAQHPSALEIVKACHCFEHQADEAPSWKGSEAAELVRAIEKHAAKHLDGYEAEEWGFACLHAPEPRPAPKPHPKPRRAAGLEKWLGVEVYRAEMGYDASAGGITSRAQTLYVPHEHGPTLEPQLALQLVPGEKGDALHFVPRVLAGGTRWTMFGGNFVHSSDSRFAERYGRQPVAVHDRVEG